MLAIRQFPKMKFGQYSHVTGEASEKVLEVAIGKEIRASRKQQKITVAELAAETNLSIDMLSKIESGDTSPSLSTLHTISSALSVPLTAFFRYYEEQRIAVHNNCMKKSFLIVDVMYDGVSLGAKN